jgi:hypothetical protein
MSRSGPMQNAHPTAMRILRSGTGIMYGPEGSHPANTIGTVLRLSVPSAMSAYSRRRAAQQSAGWSLSRTLAAGM